MKLPFRKDSFDKIFCISTLEHLYDLSMLINKYFPDIFISKKIRRIFSIFKLNSIEEVLKEFKRTVKKNGVIILTFDYPSINLKWFDYILKENNLEYKGQVDYSVYKNALYNKDLNLYCFRCILKKK